MIYEPREKTSELEAIDAMLQLVKEVLEPALLAYSTANLGKAMKLNHNKGLENIASDIRFIKESLNEIETEGINNVLAGNVIAQFDYISKKIDLTKLELDEKIKKALLGENSLLDRPEVNDNDKTFIKLLLIIVIMLAVITTNSLKDSPELMTLRNTAGDILNNIISPYNINYAEIIYDQFQVLNEMKGSWLNVEYSHVSRYIYADTYAVIRSGGAPTKDFIPKEIRFILRPANGNIPELSIIFRAYTSPESTATTVEEATERFIEFLGIDTGYFVYHDTRMGIEIDGVSYNSRTFMIYKSDVDAEAQTFTVLYNQEGIIEGFENGDEAYYLWSSDEVISTG